MFSAVWIPLVCSLVRCINVISHERHQTWYQKMRPEASEEVVWESHSGIYRSVFSHRGSQSAVHVDFGVPRISLGSPFGRLFGSKINSQGHSFFNYFLDLNFRGFGMDLGSIWRGFGDQFGTTFQKA